MRTVYCFLLCLMFQITWAQTKSDPQMGLSEKAIRNSTLFIHYDKNVYSNNEPVYFTGYLISTTANPISDHRILCVNLVREIDSALILTDKFPIENGLAMGTIVLPDSVQSGDYRLLAFTNKTINGEPEAAFVQKITIKTNFDPRYKANIKLLETSPLPNAIHKVLFSATTTDNRFLNKPIAISYRYGNLQKSVKTDQWGQIILSLAAIQDGADPNLYVKLTSEKDTSYISLALPLAKNKASVRFFPEGGNGVNGMASFIAWEVKDQQQMPLALKGFLYENHQVIDTIETGSYGIGKFKLFYKPDADYSVKLIHDGLADSCYVLPKAIPDGVIMTIPNAATADTVSIFLRSLTTKKLTIRLHNFRETFAQKNLTVNGGLQRVKIALNEVPRGLATVTISDSLDRPLAERMIFIQYKNINKPELSTHKSTYEQREEVSLQLKLNEFTENALVSIAVVQDNRLDPLKSTDFESYRYLQSELNQLPAALHGSLFNDQQAMELILLAKGWRRYSWLQDGVPPKTNVGHLLLDSLDMTGKVLRKDKELTSPVSLALIAEKGLQLLDTSPTGTFTFTAPALFTEIGRKPYLFISDKVKENFKIKIDDQFLAMAKKIRNYGNENIVPPSKLVNNYELVIKGNEKSLRLQEVVIKAKKDDRFNFNLGPSGANACGDYVCLNNIFNCQNHVIDSRNTAPISGRSYQGLSGPYRECKVYATTDETMVTFNGVHIAKEFYHNHYKDPLEPAFFSTIYWNYAVLLTNKAPTEIKFYTSDIIGKFRVVVQGISGHNVVHAEQIFNVVAKKAEEMPTQKDTKKPR